jgi:DHA1 family bicyclomycin/chloramphenicol resistance-like MFS transporter
MGYSAELFGWTFAIAAIGYVLGAFLSGRLIPIFGMDLIFRIGNISLIAGALIMVALCYFGNLNAINIILPQLLCEFGISIIVPIAVTKALQPIPENAGAGSALIGFIRFCCATLSSFLTMRFPGAISLALIILGFSICSGLSILSIQTIISFAMPRSYAKQQHHLKVE